jgi:DNA-binding SARP family transcriptional activator
MRRRSNEKWEKSLWEATFVAEYAGNLCHDPVIWANARLGDSLAGGRQSEKGHDLELVGVEVTNKGKRDLAAGPLRSELESPHLFERFLYGLALVDPGGDVLHLNRRARELLVPSERRSAATAWTCCALICDRFSAVVGAGGCLTARSLEAEGPLPEERIDLDGHTGTAAWVTASPLDQEKSKVLVHLRPGRAGDRRRQACPEWPEAAAGEQRPELHVTTLGGFKVEGCDGPIEGEWLEQRPGQLLKYLVCERGRTVPNDRIAEALWPDAGRAEGRNSLRYNVHALRERLEPDRARRSPSSFVAARRGAYALDLSQVRVDVDDFEREARVGLAAFVQDLPESAADHLDRALALYGEGFLPEDPYEEWVLDERERLHELAGRVLRAQVRIQLRLEDVDAAVSHARRLAEMEPFDTDVQRLLIDLCLRRGRRSEAFRRYTVLRKRMLQSFGQEPDFELAELQP